MPQLSNVIKLSYSQLRELIKCPYRWKLIYIDHIKPIFEIRRFLVPDVVDEALTDWIKAGFEGDLIDFTQKRFDYWCKKNVRWSTPFEKQDKWVIAKRAAFNLNFAVRKLNLNRPGVVVGQMDLEGWDSTGTLRIKGRPDLVDTERLEIWDVKTTDNPIWLDVNQLVFYHLLHLAAKKQRLKKLGFLTPLMNDVVQELEINQNVELVEMIEVIKKAVENITNQDFPPTGLNNDACYMCMVKHACCHYNKAIKIASVKKSGVRKVGL
jgi:hypothetical protein